MNSATIHKKSAMDFLVTIPDSSVDLVYTDPPFGTGDVQSLLKKSRGEIISKISYSDKHDNYLDFLDKLQSFYEKFKSKWAKIMAERKKTKPEIGNE